MIKEALFLLLALLPCGATGEQVDQSLIKSPQSMSSRPSVILSSEWANLGKANSGKRIDLLERTYLLSSIPGELTDGDAAWIISAVETIFATNDEKCVRLYLSTLRNLPTRSISPITSRLLRFYHSDSLNGSQDCRHLVLEVLAKCPHRARLMETALNSPDGVEQFLAARFFAGNRQYTERIVPILVKAMDNPDIRIAAVGVLGGMQSAARPAVPALEAALIRQTEINSHSQETLLLREALRAINNQ